MIHIGLFEGIGGFSLAAHWAGWETLATCEINPFGQKILNYYWSDAYHHGDIHTFTYDTINVELSKRFGANWRNKDIVLTGGFPCQPYSTAGKRLGKADERHLWPEMLRAIREIQPAWVVGENVRGLISWNGGMVFDEVQADLGAEGYEVLPFLLPASGVNAPHRRERIWFVAYAGLFGQEKRQFEPVGFEQLCKERLITDPAGDRRERERQGIETEKGLQQRPEPAGELAGRFEGLCFQRNAANTESSQWNDSSIKTISGREQSGTLGICNCKQDAADTGNEGLQRSEEQRSIGESWQKRNKQLTRFFQPNWENFPTESPLCGRNDGVSSELVRTRIRADCMGLLSEKEIDKIISKAIVGYRNESIKGYGNAIVPQMVFQIFKAINIHNNSLLNE